MFGGYIVHITTDSAKKPYPARQMICANGAAAAGEALVSRALEDVIRVQNQITRHNHCGLNTPRSRRAGILPIAVLQACRQIHKEVALLPFIENTFAFRTGMQLEKLLRALVLHQARAVTLINFTPQMYGIENSHTRLYTMPAQTLSSKLPGLTRAYCYAGVRGQNEHT